MTKHERFAQALQKKGVETWEQVQEYARRYKKYDNWTFRDLDKTYALIKK